MSNQTYNAIRKWAVKNVDGSLRKLIRDDIDAAWANNNSKAKKRFEFLYNLGDFENLPNAVKSIQIEERVKSTELQSCWMCGTRHADSYRASCKNGHERTAFIGRDCGKILADYGLGTGVLLSSDERTAKKKQKSLQEDLENLVLNEGAPIPILPEGGPVKETRPDFVGSQYVWLTHQELPADVRRAVTQLKDPYFATTRNELKLVMDYVAQNKKFPADAFNPVLDDVKAMEAEGKAKNVAEKLEKRIKTGEMTVAEARSTLDGVDHLGYRVEKNTALLGKYNEPLAGMLNEMLPALAHDKDLLREDYLQQRYVQNKVLNQTDYRLAKSCLNRWAFGAMEALEGADKTKLRNLAIRIESVPDFKEKLEGLVVIQRKLQYAKDNTSTEEYAQIGKVKESILGLSKEQMLPIFQDACVKAYELQKAPLRLLQTPCMTLEAFNDEYKVDVSRTLEIAGRVHAKGFLNDFKRKYLEHLREHVSYGILRKEDAPRLAKAAELMKRYVRV